MPTKDPITVTGLIATVLLAFGAILLYFTPVAETAPRTTLVSPFKETSNTSASAASQPTPPPAPPLPPALTLSDAEIKALAPADRARYEKMRQDLQQTLQKVTTLEQENSRLQQTVAEHDAKNKQLDEEISKMRSAENSSTPQLAQ